MRQLLCFKKVVCVFFLLFFACKDNHVEEKKIIKNQHINRNQQAKQDLHWKQIYQVIVKAKDPTKSYKKMDHRARRRMLKNLLRPAARYHQTTAVQRGDISDKIGVLADKFTGNSQVLGLLKKDMMAVYEQLRVQMEVEISEKFQHINRKNNQRKLKSILERARLHLKVSLGHLIIDWKDELDVRIKKASRSSKQK